MLLLCPSARIPATLLLLFKICRKTWGSDVTLPEQLWAFYAVWCYYQQYNKHSYIFI